MTATDRLFVWKQNNNGFRNPGLLIPDAEQSMNMFIRSSRFHTKITNTTNRNTINSSEPGLQLVNFVNIQQNNNENYILKVIHLCKNTAPRNESFAPRTKTNANNN